MNWSLLIINIDQSEDQIEFLKVSIIFIHFVLMNDCLVPIRRCSLDEKRKWKRNFSSLNETRTILEGNRREGERRKKLLAILDSRTKKNKIDLIFFFFVHSCASLSYATSLKAQFNDTEKEESDRCGYINIYIHTSFCCARTHTSTFIDLFSQHTVTFVFLLLRLHSAASNIVSYGSVRCGLSVEDQSPPFLFTFNGL